VLTYVGADYGWTLPSVPLVFIVLFAFFFTSVGMSSVGRRRKQQLESVEKGGPRNAWQVVANGGVATLCAVVAALLTRGSTAPSHGAYALLWGFAGAYAAATADTWSTEIGSAFGGVPRSIAGFRPIAPGASGGVTVIGSAAMVAGAAWIALVWALPQQNVRAFWIVTAAGIAGAAFDSLLGATLQIVFSCPKCERTTELREHTCGARTIPHAGLAWMTNDTVNAFATVAGAVVAGSLYWTAI
jgi:uncharacterized protein (TIGR00297 family)